MNSKLTERLAMSTGVAVQDVTVERVGAYQPMADFRRVLLLAAAGAAVATSTLTVTLMQATSAAGAGAKAVGDPVVFTAPAGAASELVAAVEAQASDLDEGFGFVAAKVLAVDKAAVPAAIYGGVRMIRGDGRFLGN